MFVFGLKPLFLQQIAVIEMEGAIGQRLKAGEYVKLLRSIEENERIRSVVLDIDSPGGSAPGSNYLYLAIKSLDAYVRIEQDRMEVVVERRAGSLWSLERVCGPEGMVRLPTVGIELPLSELYERVKFHR